MINKGPPDYSIEKSSMFSTPLCLVLVPTRELADQVYIEARKLAHKTGISVIKIFGGMGYGPQISDLKQGCDILVATPGRLFDFCEKEFISLKHVKWFILDEADRMLDMGFFKQLADISEKTGKLLTKT
jgi:superfamily II DNA/RNA helicase